MRKTVGKEAPLSHVASIGGSEIEQLLSEIAAEITAKTGEDVVIAKDPIGAEGETFSETEVGQEVLKGIIRDLHKGVDMAILKRRFHDLIKDIDATEIAKMEQKLIEEGMPESEIKRLCDVHVEAFKESLGQQEVPAVPGGHPLHTFLKEIRIAEGVVREIKTTLKKLCDSPDKELFKQYRQDLRQLIDRLSDINIHYLRKENQLFPVLELHNITGPSEGMWAIHDDVRQTLKSAREQISASAGASCL
ncbi:MAG TPA: hypothetical protein DCP92_10280 [Nitrospiraceae bacterium]|jgi:DUF438 domain-containing protein|nr:hypothetical protein [Nitrospiraceae bacterium]